MQYNSNNCKIATHSSGNIRKLSPCASENHHKVFKMIVKNLMAADHLTYLIVKRQSSHNVVVTIVTKKKKSLKFFITRMNRSSKKAGISSSRKSDMHLTINQLLSNSAAFTNLRGTASGLILASYHLQGSLTLSFHSGLYSIKQQITH